jgi:hypothetical protein
MPALRLSFEHAPSICTNAIGTDRAIEAYALSPDRTAINVDRCMSKDSTVKKEGSFIFAPGRTLDRPGPIRKGAGTSTASATSCVGFHHYAFELVSKRTSTSCKRC